MYIAIFISDKIGDLAGINTLGKVLKLMLETIGNGLLSEYAKKYDDREDFLENLEDFMGDCIGGYVIGVDVEKDDFEIFHIKYDWVIAEAKI